MNFDSLAWLTSRLSRLSPRDRRYIALILGLEPECLDQALAMLKQLVVEYEDYH